MHRGFLLIYDSELFWNYFQLLNTLIPKLHTIFNDFIKPSFFQVVCQGPVDMQRHFLADLTNWLFPVAKHQSPPWGLSSLLAIVLFLISDIWLKIVTSPTMLWNQISLLLSSWKLYEIALWSYDVESTYILLLPFANVIGRDYKYLDLNISAPWDTCTEFGNKFVT